MENQALTLREEIDALMRKAHFDSVVAACERWLEDENADTVITALLGLNIVAFSRGDFALAEQYVEQAEKVAREKGSSKALCDVLCRRCFILQAVAAAETPQEQIALAQEALTLAQAAEYPNGIAAAKINLGIGQMYAGARVAAHGTLEEAVELSRHATSSIEVDALNALASLYFWRNMPAKAIDNGTRALKIARASDDDLATCMLLIGMNYFYAKVANDFGARDTSVNYSRQALDLARRLGYFYGELCALFALARAYRTSNRNRQAVDTFAEALALVRAWGNKSWEHESLASLAEMHHLMREEERALDYANQELAVAIEMGKPGWKLHAWYTLGNIYSRMKRHDVALDYWRKALALQKEQGWGRGLRYRMSQFTISTYPFFHRSARK